MRTRLVLGFSTLALPAIVLAVQAPVQDSQDVASAKRDRLKDNAANFWIYDDIDKGYALAEETGKPLLVSFRCVP